MLTAAHSTKTYVLAVYGAKVTHVRAPQFGSRPSLDDISAQLQKGVQSGSPFKLISLTHVDTSTSVLVDIKAVADLVHQLSPTTLISVDGVCSVGAETIKQEEWGIDVVMTASQKAIGVPPGLGISKLFRWTKQQAHALLTISSSPSHTPSLKKSGSEPARFGGGNEPQSRSHNLLWIHEKVAAVRMEGGR